MSNPTGTDPATHHTAVPVATAGGGCHCGEQVSGTPELDVRVIPHEVRHPAILGALGSLRPGRSLVLAAPHEPVPLLRQVAAAHPAAFEISYLERGPETWRLRFTRTAAGHDAVQQ